MARAAQVQHAPVMETERETTHSTGPHCGESCEGAEVDEALDRFEPPHAEAWESEDGNTYIAIVGGEPDAMTLVESASLALSIRNTLAIIGEKMVAS